MSTVILIMGEPGQGKTTSMQNLNPETTVYFDCDKKGLPWRGWRKQYNKEKENYFATSNAGAIYNALESIDKEKPEIKTVVVDTLNWIMIDEEFKRMKEKGYDKWQDLAFSVKALISKAKQLRDDLTAVFVAHTQTETDDSGMVFTRMKTSGKKLEKISVESMFNTVLLAKCVDGHYFFETQARNSTARSPMGAFETFEIDNDIVEVIKVLEEF